VLAAVGCGSSSSDGGTGGTSGSGGTTGGTGGASGGVTYDVDVKPIFMAKCTPCHATGGTGALFHTMATSYTDVMKNSNACPGKKKGECAVERVHNGTMPYQKGCTGNPAMDTAKPECTTAAEQAKLDAWVANGLKEK
jgi:hypothetical protein